MEMLKLTDDEVCALALRYDGVVRPPLPTIDERDDAELLAGLLRGRRSLVARDLGDLDGSPLGDALEVYERLSVGPCAMFSLADADGNWVKSGFTAYLYGAVTSVEMSQVIAEAGLHYFRIVPSGRQWQTLIELAESVYADGFAGLEGQGEGEGPAPAAALLHVVRPDGIRFVKVAQGSVTTGRGPVPARFPSVADAVAWLLA